MHCKAMTLGLFLFGWAQVAAAAELPAAASNPLCTRSPALRVKWNCARPIAKLVGFGTRHTLSDTTLQHPRHRRRAALGGSRAFEADRPRTAAAA